MSEKICTKCNGQMDNGYLAASGRDAIIYTTLNPAGKYETVSLDAYACLDCGYVELLVNNVQLRKITGK